MQHRPLLTGSLAAMLQAAMLLVAGAVTAAQQAPAADPSKTTFGEISPAAPPQLKTFSFLIGQWEGTGKSRRDDGTYAEYPIKWIGRYILDGTAIADEAHGPGPDGTEYLGISFRQFDDARRTWIFEFLNVNGSFLRRQVRQGNGAVTVSGRNVTVESESPGMKIREHYLVPEPAQFTYQLDLSTDGGRTWTEKQIEMNLRRFE
jgi:hypothetical protein